ncbi:transcriptional regulator with XRE-family HTH domain [Natronocella acetinitrilica]|uniref:Transcriptional regulator with XRE-family HTH domain n=1 Tax=Natronocella acetinitrilica TaxID=414046 RepID=A0AAE3G245_9GAMM|nr:helix-turn-helix transcriptional regulator [Natronocella acetinitrilica]MCP1674356.1 transcriptional regulator with XRE-family HTH domain [Natronocella acetinitrilica]
MAKRASRGYTHYSEEAVRLLGEAIRQGRIARRMTAEELAERAGVSRGLVQRAERGEMGCTIGAVFELAAIAGVPLFEADPVAARREALPSPSGWVAAPVPVLPRRARRKKPVEPKDDF